MDSSLPRLLESEHRNLDELFGRFLGAAAAADAAATRDAIADFDDELSRHTAFEEERVLREPSGRNLAPSEGEEETARLHRDLRLEHVQVRELSAMIRRLLEERGDLEGARRLAPNLARRWDAHTAREEKELFPALQSSLPERAPKDSLGRCSSLASPEKSASPEPERGA